MMMKPTQNHYNSHRFPSSEEKEERTPTEVPEVHRTSPGFLIEQRHIPTLEEATYEFPPGAGVSEEEVEKVEDHENYWKIKDMVLQPQRYTEEAKKYIDHKLQYVEDYFDRLQCGHLTPADLKEKRPQNFDEPYYPTPRQLEVCVCVD